MIVSWSLVFIAESPCGISGGRAGIGTYFNEPFRFPVSITMPKLHAHSPITSIHTGLVIERTTINTLKNEIMALSCQKS